ncbi:MAG TPA: DNA-3-methyladenine glycosylase [Candidatus Polarisedimenticolia bacterium]|jgi:DNA-3-methyladenine glycosylase
MASLHGALKRSFYRRSALEVAPDLLGKLLCHLKDGVLTSGRIVEVEAYLGAKDPASHAYRGPTQHNRAMFGPAGRAYIYFTYGNHFCMNVVTGEEGVASAVLIRALAPHEGIEVMKRRRDGRPVTGLASGPGKLTAALGIDRRLYGHDLTRKPLWIRDDGEAPARWVRTPRIGIRQAADRLYRFVVAGSPFASRKA